MHSATWLRLGWIPLVVLLAACGSSGDDESGDDDGMPTRGSQSGDGTPVGPSSSNEGRSQSRVSEIKDANYGNGKVHVEVSGDAKATFDADGTGFASDGFALLTYGSRDAAVLISFSSNKGEEGALSLTTYDYAGAWEWGKDCKLSAEQSDGKFKGDFSCDKVEAVSPTSSKAYKLSIKGSFTAEP